MNALLAALTRRGYCLDEAREEIAYMVERILNYDTDPEEILHEAGLEPDYVFDLLELAGL
jgi:hypothetical protein